jgi:hypothetical protein
MRMFVEKQSALIKEQATELHNIIRRLAKVDWSSAGEVRAHRRPALTDTHMPGLVLLGVRRTSCDHDDGGRRPHLDEGCCASHAGAALGGVPVAAAAQGGAEGRGGCA